MAAGAATWWRSAWLSPLLVLAAGIMAAVAHPPFGLLPGLVGYALLLDRLDTTGRAPLASAFFRGWLAGTAYFAIGTWWIAEAFFVDAAAHGWMAPIAVIGMAGGLGLFWGAAGLLYRVLAPRGVSRIIIFASAMALLEWLRGHVLTGFPWNLPGETWRAGSAMSQAASVLGAYGLTWLTVMIASAPALVRDGRKGLIVAGGAVLLLAGTWAWGAHRLQRPTPAPSGPVVRLVQANVPQSDKYDASLFRSIVTRYVDLTRAPGPRPVDIVIWPEGAIPDQIDSYLAPGSWAYEQINGAMRPGQALLVGGYRVLPRGGRPLYFNTFVALRRNTVGLSPLGFYDKHRLVPFGEYIPLDRFLAPLGLHQLVQVGEGFSTGPEPQPLALPGLPVMQPLICYESLFPGFTRRGARLAGQRASVIINVSNDAWFGATSGPLQHLNLASYRAIEEGLPMLRSTPTGVTAVIDAFGRTRSADSLPHGVMGVLDRQIPSALPPTIYAQTGDLTFALFLGLSGLLALWGNIRLFKRGVREPDLG